MNVFVCGTIFQVITAINIRVTSLLDNTDLILTDSTDFSNIENTLEELGIFHKIYHMKDDACKKDYWTMNEQQRKYLSKNPSYKHHLSYDRSYER